MFFRDGSCAVEPQIVNRIKLIYQKY